MPTDKEIEAGVLGYNDKITELFPSTPVLYCHAPLIKAALEAAEKARLEDAVKDTEFGDIGIDAADRLYRNVLGKWVAQGRPSTPVYPVKVIHPRRSPKMSCWSKEELENMLEDVVNELDLSDTAIEKHGPLGTPPAELVRLVLEQKDLEIRALKQGFKSINPPKKDVKKCQN